jgi:hypothetical protein
MPHTQPGSLHELSLWLVGSEEMAASLRTACGVEVLDPDTWATRFQAGESPAFLLVEGDDEAEGRWGDQLDLVLDASGRAEIPCILWFTFSPIGPWWLSRCARFDHVLAAERWQVPELEAAGVREPSTLWPATALPLDSGATERTYPAVWLGGWNRDWPADWRERLASVLSGAAERGLRIVPVADLDGLPADLQRCVVAAEDGASALRNAKVAIGADAVVGSPTFVPAVVFDATACGAAVLTPHDFVTIHEMAVGKVADGTWRNMIPIVHDGRIAVEELDRLLADEQYRIEVVAHTQRIVAHNHTYAHRVATLASAAGHRLVHDTAALVTV